MTIVKAQRQPGTGYSPDHSRVTANLYYKDSDIGEERIILPISALKEALSKNRGMGILDVQLEGEGEPRHVIINRFVKSKDGRHLAHLVLKEVADSDRVRAMVPIVGTGVLPSRKRDIIVTQKCKAVDLRGPVGSLGQPIKVRVSDLHSGDVVRARDLEMPTGVTLCSDPDTEIFRAQAVPTA